MFEKLSTFLNNCLLDYSCTSVSDSIISFYNNFVNEIPFASIMSILYLVIGIKLWIQSSVVSMLTMILYMTFGIFIISFLSIDIANSINVYMNSLLIILTTAIITLFVFRFMKML